MNDDSEDIRRQMVAEINSHENTRVQLEAQHGQVWNTQELQQDFEVLGFAAPFVVVVRKSDKRRGTLTFSHNPRFYFDLCLD